MNLFDIFISRYLNKNRPKIGFGLANPDSRVLKSLRRSKKYAQIFLVGPKQISAVKGFEKVISANPEKKITELLISGQVKGIIRGTIDDFKTRETYRRLLAGKKIKKFIELGLMQDVHGRQFYASDVSNPDGWTLSEKINSSSLIVKFMTEVLDIVPKIGCVTGVRHNTYARKKGSRNRVQRALNGTYEDAEHLVKYYKERGINIKNYAIEIETALAESCNLIVPPNGMVGNQMFRTLVYLGGGKLLAAPVINLPHYWEDNSRNEVDFENHVKWLTAWINSSLD